jgi:hypothetical protein
LHQKLKNSTPSQPEPHQIWDQFCMMSLDSKWELIFHGVMAEVNKNAQPELSVWDEGIKIKMGKLG